ncbi:Protein translation factor SUI1-like protein [Vigna angularis]|uniref:Protein translation factor SUI1-like protein n=1 Tax=Phaseolus angularis TaxID=3914 RepID=A0A8T0KBQ3_PHAAN|nr:Protein translation factor SUI1-like protein [Vigna angularis]
MTIPQRFADIESNNTFTSALSNLGFRFLTVLLTYRNLKFRISVLLLLFNFTNMLIAMSGLNNLVGGTFGHRESSFMSELDDQIPTAFDPFAEANADDSGAGSKEYVHIRVQQRNGRKSLTTVQGLKKEFSYNKILKDVKKEFCCNGTVVQDPELGQVIQLQGDQRKNVSAFLVQVTVVLIFVL